MSEERTGPVHAVGDRLRAFRESVHRRPGGERLWRIGVGVVGAIVLALGIVAIPYPGPGWLIVFAGLGILASEFDWAKRLLAFARRYYDAFTDWLGRQNLLVKGLFGLFTCAIVLGTLWLLGAIGMVAGWVGIHWDWLQSPLRR